MLHFIRQTLLKNTHLTEDLSSLKTKGLPPQWHHDKSLLQTASRKGLSSLATLSKDEPDF